MQVGAPEKTKQGHRLVTLGVSEEGNTDTMSQDAINTIHQMDSVLDLRGDGACFFDQHLRIFL